MDEVKEEKISSEIFSLREDSVLLVLKYRQAFSTSELFEYNPWSNAEREAPTQNLHFILSGNDRDNHQTLLVKTTRALRDLGFPKVVWMTFSDHHLWIGENVRWDEI